MNDILQFLEILLPLVIEGTAIALLLLPRAPLSLAIALALPLSAFANVLIVFAYTVLGVPLTFTTILGAHLILILGLIALIKFRPVFLMDLERPMHERTSMVQKIVIACCAVLLTIIAVYSFSHAVLLPSAQYDSATNWTMRSKISFEDQAIAFDATEDRGMAKPQYPFLFHALQIAANQGQNDWNDASANAILYALSLSTFAALFLIFRKLRNASHAIVAVTAIAGIPLLSLHLAQGYGDLNLAQYLLLSLACLGLWIESTSERKSRWLVLSGIFAAAAVWTKSEGSVFGLVPWFLVVALVNNTQKDAWKKSLPAILVAIALAVPWPIFAWVKGLSLTPHSSDTMISFHAEGLMEAMRGLFSRGSFGVLWYALLVLVPVIFVYGIRKYQGVSCRQLPTLFFGLFVFVIVLFIYLFTPNVRFLLNAESYYRQMMVPGALLVLGCALCLQLKQKNSN